MLINRKYAIPFVLLLLSACHKEQVTNDWLESNYKGNYPNIAYSEKLIKSFSPGIYTGKDIPSEIPNLRFGRIEIDFQYAGGALNYFSPLFYYGSVNNDESDDSREEPKFHLAIEIGHYNVIPFPIENLFYTLSTFRQPLYCRDTDSPITSGIDYTMVVDKRPEGILLQLKRGDHILNIFPHAFFPDSSQMFFDDITQNINKNKGDSLTNVLMVGKGFAGFEKGLHEFNGKINALRIYKYDIDDIPVAYELQKVRNQHNEGQQITYDIINLTQNNDKLLQVKHEFHPYQYMIGELIPKDEVLSDSSMIIPNDGQSRIYRINESQIGLHKLTIKTITKDGALISQCSKPFEIWVYPKSWQFDFY